MHVERIRFDEIFDVAPRHGAFSFKSQGRTRYAATLGHRQVPREGDTFAVAFERADDWSTVLGWRDLRLNAVVLKYPLRWWAVLSELGDILIVGPALFAAGLLLGGVAAALLAALLPAGFACYKLHWMTRRNRQVVDDLLALPRIPDARTQVC